MDESRRLTSGLAQISFSCGRVAFAQSKLAAETGPAASINSAIALHVPKTVFMVISWFGLCFIILKLAVRIST
jgi:hypothetical protein